MLTSKVAETLKSNEKNFQKTCSDLLNSTNLTLASTSSLSTSSSSAAFSQLSSSGPQFPGRATMPNVGSMSQFRAQLWMNMEKLSDTMYDSCSQVYQLQQILEKKKDLLTNLFYLDEIDFGSIFPNRMYLVAISSFSTDSVRLG